MTIQKSTRLQDELRDLFRKYGVTSGVAMFVHDETMHFVESHVTEKHQWVVATVDALQQSITELYPNIPVVNYNNTQQN